MSKHTTTFTTNPDLRARERIRQALWTLVSESRISADAFGQFSNDREVDYWTAVGQRAQELLGDCDATWDRKDAVQRLKTGLEPPVPAPSPGTYSSHDHRPVVPVVGYELGRHDAREERD